MVGLRGELSRPSDPRGPPPACPPRPLPLPPLTAGLAFPHPSLLQRKGPEQCTCCRGCGETECLWCHGTGAMTVGDTLFCSEQGCKPCPVCHGSVSAAELNGHPASNPTHIEEESTWCALHAPYQCFFLPCACAGRVQVRALPRHRQAGSVDGAGRLPYLLLAPLTLTQL